MCTKEKDGVQWEGEAEGGRKRWRSGVRARQEIRWSRETHRKSSLFLWIIAQAGPSQYCPILSVHLPIIPSLDGAKTRVEIYFSPRGPGWFAHPQEASYSTPQLSISAYFPHRTSVKKKFKKKKKEKPPPRVGYKYSRQNTRRALVGRGLLPHWPVSNHSRLFTVFTNLVHCTIRVRRPSPETTMSTPACPQPGAGRGQVRRGRKRQRLMRVSVGETEAEASREI